MKICSTCELEKPFECYPRDYRSDTRKKTQCKDCVSAAARARRQNTPEASRRIQRAFNLDLGKHLDASDALKVCSYCRVSKPFREFNRASDNKDGHSSVCKPCAVQYNENRRQNDSAARKKMETARRKRVLGKYRLTEETLSAMLKLQNNTCAICQRIFGSGRRHTYHIDHDHKTGVVRALLCNNCNLGLGNFYDSPEKLRQAADFLEKHVNKQ